MREAFEQGEHEDALLKGVAIGQVGNRGVILIKINLEPSC